VLQATWLPLMSSHNDSSLARRLWLCLEDDGTSLELQVIARDSTSQFVKEIAQQAVDARVVLDNCADLAAALVTRLNQAPEHQSNNPAQSQ
jgi:hypothetical protein